MQPLTNFVRADANADGQINVADPVLTLALLFQGSVPTCLVAHDSNDDEQIDIGDIIFTLNYIFNSGAQPAEPFSQCGPDPTASMLECSSYGACN